MSMGIEVKNLTKRFGEKTVFKNFSCFFPAGETTFIMGPSGCGKTTLLMLLMGLLPYDGGSIYGLQGKRRSAVFQEDRLCGNVSAVTNLRLVNKNLSKEEAAGMLAALGLAEELHKPVREFSGGMRQRVSILRALAAPYDVLFLDEPFHGLDADTKQLTMRYFQEKTQGKTVLCVTHDESEPELLGGRILYLTSK